MSTLLEILRSTKLFYSILLLFAIGSTWIAISSIYPMAFDEEFHYGLIKIYASSILPYGIEHTSDMAQFGSATADASYLFHYLMSFPYRVLDAFGFSDTAIITILRIFNIGFVVGALLVFKKAFDEAQVSAAVSNISLLLVTLIPIFPLLTAHINYDNLLFLLFAWCVLCTVRITNVVRNGKPFPLGQSVQLFCAVLIGMSIKYAFLPFALGIFIWLLWLLILGYRIHKQTISSQLKSLKRRWKVQGKHKRIAMISLTVLSLFFASHYVTNTLSYGSPIPSCERVFTETECAAYGPWNRNKSMEARKSESFQPMPYSVYMAKEWVPGMTQRLLFAVAGKTNDFQTKLPLPALVYTLVSLSILGVLCAVVQMQRKKASWLAAFTLLLTVIYTSVLSFQLYGDYVDTAEPVAINGRYLLPLLPLVSVVLIQAMLYVARKFDRRIIASLTVAMLILITVAGGGIGTYIVQSESHWFRPGFGQDSQAFAQPILEKLILPARY